MIEGLKNLGEAGRDEIAKLIGKHGSLTHDETLHWIAKTIDCKDKSPEKIERAALAWVAKFYGLPTDDAISTDDLERSIRLRVAAEASDYLAPTWALVCALIAQGPTEAAAPKLKMLERAAILVVPSRHTRQELMKSWQELVGKRPTLEDLKPHLEKLKGRPERVDQALNLGLVITLADGRLGLEEEQMVIAIGTELGKTQTEIKETIRRVNSLYWGHQVEVGPKSSASVDPKADKEAALKAAELTLGSSGALEGLALEGREHEELQGTAPKSGWNRMLGAFSGLYSYLQHRMSDHDQRTLVRIVYLSILQQHAAVAARAAQDEPPEETAVAAPERAKQYREVAQTPQRRAIKLEE